MKQAGVGDILVNISGGRAVMDVANYADNEEKSNLCHMALESLVVPFPGAEKHSNFHRVSRQCPLPRCVGSLQTHRRERLELCHEDLELCKYGLWEGSRHQ